MREKPSISRQISRLATPQHGHATRKQLAALGLGADAIDYRIATGELIVVHAGVYAVGHRELGPIPIAAAVVLACGDGAVLSHDSAAALWRLGSWPKRQDVTAPQQRRRPNIRTHRSTTLTHDVTVHYGIPVTTPVRTICDIAPRRTDDDLLQAVDDARLATYLTPTALEELIDRCPRLSRLVDPDSGPTRSRLERAFKLFATKYDLPPYRVNVKLHGYEVDVVFDAEKLIVELDGWIFHRGRKSHDENRERDTHLKDHGYDTIRITSKRIGEREAARLHRILRNQR